MSVIRFGIVLLLTALAIGFGPATTSRAATPEVYTIGVIPSVPPVPTHAQWAPFVEQLSRETGLEFQLKLYEQMAAFEREIVSSTTPDFIFSHALQLVVAHEAEGYLPLVAGSMPIRAVLFVARDSPIQTIGDLEGKRIAFVGDKNL